MCSRIFWEMAGRARALLGRLLPLWGGEACHYINGPETLPPPLTKEEEAEVFENIRQGKPGAREPDAVNQDIEQEAERAMLLSAVDRLPPREKAIMTLRFGLASAKEHTQKEVADRLGISQSYISRLEKRIIHRLRRELEKAG